MKAKCLWAGGKTRKSGSGGTSLVIGSQDTNGSVTSFNKESILVIRDEDAVNNVDDGRAASVNIKSNNLHRREIENLLSQTRLIIKRFRLD